MNEGTYKRYITWWWHPRHWHLTWATYDAWQQTITERWVGPVQVVTFKPEVGEGTE